MKIQFLGVCLLLLLANMSYGQSSTDQAQIEKHLDQLMICWNTRDFSFIRENATEDVMWVNIVGMWWKGKEEVVKAHEGIFNAFFKGVPFTKKSTHIRFIKADVVVANLICSVGEYYPPDGINHGNNKRPAVDNLLSLVFVKNQSKWLLTSAQNTVIDAEAAKHNPAIKK